MSTAAQAGTIRLAQISDIHVGAAEPAVTRALMDDLTAQAPDATILCGDLTMRARRGQFAQALALLNRLPQPMLVVPGNHDIPLINLGDRLRRPYDKYRAGIGPDLDPMLDLPGARILGLNTMPRWRWKAGRASKRQCGLVESELGQAPPGAARILVTHHPVLPKDLSSFTGRSKLVASAARARVDLMMAGHTHDPSLAPVMLQADGMTVSALSSVTGTAVSSRRRGADNAYVMITITPTKIVAEVRTSAGRGFATELVGTYTRSAPRG